MGGDIGLSRRRPYHKGPLGADFILSFSPDLPYYKALALKALILRTFKGPWERPVSPMGAPWDSLLRDFALQEAFLNYICGLMRPGRRRGGQGFGQGQEEVPINNFLQASLQGPIAASRAFEALKGLIRL